MKKLSMMLSILMVICLVHQTSVFAEAAKEKKPTKKNFGVKKKHMAAAATPAPATPKAA